jgi:hypothetical protein
VIDQALEQLHFESFIAWLNLSLQEQTEDLELYMRSSEAGMEALDGLHKLVEHSIPAGRPDVERRLVLSDLDVVTAIVRADM